MLLPHVLLGSSKNNCMTLWRQLGFSVGFATLYAASMVFSDLLAADTRFGIAPIWPPAGIGFACLLLGGLRAWPVIVIGYLAGQVFSVVELPLSFLVLAFSANVLAPIAAVYMVRRYWPDRLLKILLRNGVTIFLAGGLLAVMSSFLGTLGADLSNLVPSYDLAEFGVEWFLGDLFGVIVCTPALLNIGRAIQSPDLLAEDFAFQRHREKAGWILMALAAAWIWLWLSEASSTYALALTFVPFAFLGWSALRFDFLFTTLAVMVLVLTVAVVIQQGVAGFTPPQTALERVVLLFFLSFMAVLPLLVGAAAHQNRFLAHRLSFRAHHDSLTGLPNRAALEDAVAEALTNARESGVGAALCYLDLDSFKVVNDTSGHTAGDELLKQIAHVLASNNRPGDFLARLGGDEFGFVFQTVNANQALELAQRLTRIIDQFRFVWRKNIFAFTASAGVAMIDRSTQTSGKVLSAADTACYDAKQKGGNRVSVSEGGPDASKQSTAMQWAVRINKAIEKDQFELYCQPIVHLDDSDDLPVHIEVLLRLTGEDGNNMPPGMFIPAAESFNLMPRVDRWVVQHTLEYLRRHPQELSLVGTCSINLSGKSLGDPRFLDEITELLKGSNVPCSKLCFEVTETAAIGDLSNATRVIDSLRRLGCRFALDDFGSGLSSFGYLKSLDVDFIKIDGVFIRDLLDNPLDLAVVKAINEVGHVLGKITIAEYVEDQQLASQLAEMGVDMAQGHAFGKAQPMTRYFKELKNRLEQEGRLEKLTG
jgi:diguanylate cyclase (GGDEF)-like protein